MAEDPEVQFTDTADGEAAGEDSTISASVNTGIHDSTVESNVYIVFEVYVDGSRIARDSRGPFTQDEVVSFSTAHSFSSGKHELRAEADVDYFNSDDTSLLAEAEAQTSTVIAITEQRFTAGEELPQASNLATAYDESIDFEIDNIVGSETGPVPDNITFNHPNPAIGTDTGGKFVTHEILGGATVRQRTGDRPLELSIDGVATAETISQLELLRNALSATLLSGRFSDNSIRVHIVSVTTDPLSDGGAVDLKSGEFLYTFSLECVEILDTEGGSTTTDVDEGNLIER